MFEVVEHLDNWEKTIKKIKKNLNKKGLIIISTINRNPLSKLFAINIAENILNWIPKGTLCNLNFPKNSLIMQLESDDVDFNIEKK